MLADIELFQVIKNLLISKIELRADDAIDIKRYTHTRSVDKVIVKLTEQIIDLRERYFSVSLPCYFSHHSA